MQLLTQCLTPWLELTRALFAVLGRYAPLQLGRLCLDFGGFAPQLPLLYLDMTSALEPGGQFINAKHAILMMRDLFVTFRYMYMWLTSLSRAAMH
jgi:hypothetical protein